MIDNADGSRTKSTVAVDLRKKASDAATRSEAGAALATWKHQHTGPRARRVSAARAAKAYWDGITPSDRKIEMRRRRKLGMLRRKKRALGQKEDG